MKNPFISGVLCLALVGTQPWAPPAPAAAQGMPSSAVLVRKAGAIAGTVWYDDNSPVANGLLRLRSLITGQVVTGTESDATGRFGFEAIVPGSYLVELVDGKGSIRAVGHMLSVGPGETIATFIRLKSKDRWFDGFFSNAAASALAAAASLGVTAVGDGAQPASARF